MKYVERKVGNHIMKIDAIGGGINQTLRDKPNKEREPELLYILREEIKPEMVCMDLGANIGYVTLLMAERVGPKGLIHAVEPDPANFKLLNMNIDINKYSKIVKSELIAISDKSGEIDFFVGKNASNLGSINKHKKTLSSPIKVKTESLTNYFKGKIFPNLIKMDIEGAEILVLKGMYERAKEDSFPCKIVMELHPDFYPKKEGLDFWLKKFFDINFNPKYVVSAGVIHPDKFKKWGYTPVKSFASNRGLYNGFSKEHTIEACCFENKQWMPSKKKYSSKIARFLMIERNQT